MNKLRLHYESKVERRVSDSHWWKVRKLLKNANLELTEQNIDQYLKIKKYFPRYCRDIAEITYKLIEFTRFFESRTFLTGNEFLYYLSSQENQVSILTINNWFKPLGGFRRYRVYNEKELTLVLVPAIIYQIKQDKLNA